MIGDGKIRHICGPPLAIAGYCQTSLGGHCGPGREYGASETESCILVRRATPALYKDPPSCSQHRREAGENCTGSM